MQSRFGRRSSYVFLCISPILMVIIGILRPLNIPNVQYTIAAILIAMIFVAAWILGARAIRSGSGERRRLALAGGLIVVVWASLPLITVWGTPGQATVPENKLRYLVLLIDTIAMAGGLVILREALFVAGERFYSALGFATIILAGLLYLFFTSVMIETYRELANSELTRIAIGALGNLSDVSLFFGGVLTYAAAAAFAAALGRAQWLSRGATRAFMIASLFGLLCLVIRGFEFPNPSVVFQHWYTIPGYVAGIPAVPWIIPCLIGFCLLRRAGDDSLLTPA